MDIPRLSTLIKPALLIAVAICGAGPAALAQPRPEVPVTAERVTRKDVPLWLRGIGTVQANYAVQVRPRVDGTLMSVPVSEGQDVKAGDVLATIDPRPYQAALDAVMAKRQQDQAQLANAQADLARYSALASQNFASRQQVETQTAVVKQITATVAGDDAQVEAAALNLAFCRIVAPFDGRVGLRNTDPGNFVRAAEATAITSVAQVQPIAVTFTVPQDNVPAIVRAMGTGSLAVVVYASDDRTELDRGTLLTLDNSVDAATGTIKLKATFPNARRRLWPGQFVNARLLLGTDANVVAVPAPAVQHGPNGLFVYRLDANGTVAVQPVEVSRQEGGLAVIASGLGDDATIVTEGQSRLQNGARVAVRGTPAKSGS
jgi:multidrug efflux system membrane fusion protein